MKKFTIKAVAVAIVSVCGSAAFAGSITAPAADAAATKYAVEGLINTTDLTSGSTVVYTMGVSRTAAQDFTIIMTPSAGATFTAGYCAATLPVGGGAGALAATVKRASATECAYEIDVTTATDTTTTLTFAAPVIDAHTLATAGNSVSVSLNLWDLGETARIDNSSAVTRMIMLSGNALSITAAADTATVANVNHAAGPLFGFLANATAPADTAAVAAARFVVNNNNGATTYKTADGATNWDFNLHGTSIAVTVAGTNFTGVASAAVVPPAGGAPVVTVGAAAATFSLLPANIVGGPGAYNVDVSMTSAQTSSLGTSRVFGVSAVGDVIIGADVTLAGNAAWWTWTANAIQLLTPYMSTDAGTGVLTRFFFQNTGPAATYTATCQAETGKTVTAGTAASGTLANGQTVIDAKNVCSFSTGIRGSVTFTINAPAANIKGNYNLGFNGNSSTFVPLERPYAAGTY